MLRVQAISCEREGRQLFRQLSFDVTPGQLLQVAGPNGSGKTTLLRTLCGLIPLQSGQVFWHGQDIRQQRPAFAAATLFLGHATGVKATLSPRENLRWYFALRQTVSDRAIDEALERVGLYGYEDTPCHNLSAGQQRRVALARLQLSRAELWVLDEPFTAIDKQGVAELESLLTDFAAAGGAVLLTTHHQFAGDYPVQLLTLGEAA